MDIEFNIGEELEYQDKRRKNRVGTIEEIEIRLTREQKIIIYTLSTEDGDVVVDGETFFQI